MSIKQLLSIGLLASFGLSAIAQPLLAAAAKESTNDDVLITGYTPGQKVEVQYSSVSKEKDITANNCGFLTISGLVGTSVVTVGTTSYTLSSVSTGAKPDNSTCPFVGQVKVLQDDNTYKLYVGASPNTRESVTIQGPSIRSVTANACGFIKLSNTGPYEDKTFSIGGSAVTPTTVAVLPQCKNGVPLYPAGFTP
jgi:hypothetical protein